MPYGYLGQNQPNQTVSNSGVFSITDVAELQSQGKLGGSLELIAEQTASGTSATVEFLDNMQENIYDVHLLQISGWQSSDNNRTFILRLYESGVLESGSVYQYAYLDMESTGTFTEMRSTADTLMARFDTADSYPNPSANIYLYFYNLGNSSKYSFCNFQYTLFNYLGNYRAGFGGGVLPQASLVNGIQISTQTGNLYGNYKLFGLKQI
jgi:hypothetical protein